jgi:hypothetical protein
MKASIRVVARSRKARVLDEMLKIIYGGSARNERKNEADLVLIVFVSAPSIAGYIV